MDRRRFLGAGLMAGLSLSGIAFTQTNRAPAARASGLPDLPPGGATRARGLPACATREPGLPNWPLFEWEQPGGLVGPGEGSLQPPPLAIYGDDSAYADAAKLLKLPPAWVSTLRDHALEVLNTPADLQPAGPPPGDHPDDQVRVRTNQGDFLSVRLKAWQDGDPHHVYPPQLRELYQHAMSIRRHVLHTGRPWQPTGVLLALVALDHRPGHFRPWPAALPTPDSEPYQEFRLPDGPHGLSRATGDPWPCYRWGQNRFLAATWRPLLPHEIT